MKLGQSFHFLHGLHQSKLDIRWSFSIGHGLRHRCLDWSSLPFCRHFRSLPNRFAICIDLPFSQGLHASVGARLWARSIHDPSLLKNLIQAASIRQRLDARIMLYMSVTPNYVVFLQFHLCQEASVAFPFALVAWKSVRGTIRFDTEVSPSVIAPKPKLANNGCMSQGRYSSSASPPPPDLAGGSDKDNISIGIDDRRLHLIVQSAHVRAQSIHTLLSLRTRVNRNLAIKPSPRPS
jgi:hypothetical protein